MNSPGNLPAFSRRSLAVVFRAAASGVFLASCSSSASLDYLRRFVFWSPSGTQDWSRFPARAIARAPAPPDRQAAAAPEGQEAPRLREVTYLHGGTGRTVDLDAALAESGTTAFIVIHDGKVVREDYLAGHQRDSMTRAFSVSKSFTSALVGIALAEGKLGGIDDPFVAYVPELRGRGYDGITLRHLLRMTGGFRFSSGRFPWKDSPLLYWHPDLRGVILAGPPVVAPPGERFVYSDYSTAVLALVLERATGTSVSSYFEQKIWTRIGAEYDATWSIDHEGNGLEYTASGLNARAIDLVKLGSLYLDGGSWGGRQVVPREWVAESVTPGTHRPPGLSERERSEKVFYGHGWWGHELEAPRAAFFAHGYQGQLIYVCPAKRLVIARFGSGLGSVGEEWPMLLLAIADTFPTP